MKESTAKVRALPAIASIVGSAASRAAGLSSLRVVGPTYATVQALLSSNNGSIAAVVIYPVDAKQALEWVVELRRDARFALAPIFTARVWIEAVAALTDGIATDPAQIFQSIHAIEERQLALSARGPLAPEERLLAFLYTRADYVIQPLCDWTSEHVYSYPLLDAFAPAGTNGLDWSAALRRRSFLEPVALVDRVRECPSCAGSHLNFIDVCPQCASIDIGETIFLHCHACGHVAQQEEFLSHNALTCPKCAASLRHIGVDYDRALETFSCVPCHGRFTEPEIKARCLHCNKVHRTEDLQVRRIDSLRLSEAGQLVARTGHVGELFALLDEFQCAHPAYFEQTLEFLMNLSRRHAEIEFGLVCLKFTNVRELLAHLPRVQVSQMIDGIAMRLRELVRTTDIVLRSDDQHCWLLLPQTPAAGVEVLISRIRKIPDAVATDSSVRLALSIASITSPQLREKRIEPPLLMAELQSQVQ